MSSAEMQREINRLATDLRRLREQVPVRLGMPSLAPSTYMFQIIGGNTLAYLPGGVGVKKITTTLTALPSGYSNGTPTTLVDGAGWARSMDDDAFVIVINDALSLISHDVVLNTPVFAVQQTTLSDGIGGTYAVYRVTGAI